MPYTVIRGAAGGGGGGGGPSSGGGGGGSSIAGGPSSSSSPSSLVSSSSMSSKNADGRSLPRACARSIARAICAWSSDCFFFDSVPAMRASERGSAGAHDQQRGRERQRAPAHGKGGAPGFLGAYCLAMHVSRRAQPFLLRSFQCLPARTSSQYLHLDLGVVLFGRFLRRRLQ